MRLRAPGHDPMVLQRCPATSQTAQGIACRLDVEPQAQSGIQTIRT